MSGPVRGLAFIDAETTGLGPSARAWEIAVIRRFGFEPGVKEERILLQVEGFTSEMFEPAALEVAGFGERYGLTEGAVMASTAAAAVMLAGLLADFHLVGANPAYDAGVVGALLRDEGHAPHWHFRLVDVEALAMGALRLPAPKGLQASARALGIDFDPVDMHTAMGDAELARKIHDQIIWKERP